MKRFLSLLIFTAANCSMAQKKSLPSASLPCFERSESDCRESADCSPLFAFDLDAKTGLYVGCERNDAACGDGISCYLNKETQKRVLRSETCMVGNWEYFQCSESDIESAYGKNLRE